MLTPFAPLVGHVHPFRPVRWACLPLLPRLFLFTPFFTPSFFLWGPRFAQGLPCLRHGRPDRCQGRTLRHAG